MIISMIEYLASCSNAARLSPHLNVHQTSLYVVSTYDHQYHDGVNLMLGVN
jgi:hypothetical protein